MNEIKTAYFHKKDTKQKGAIDLSQFTILLKKSEVERLFGLKSPKVLNVFTCRHKGVTEKRKIDGKEETLIDFFEVLPFLVKHTKRMVKNTKEKQKKAENETSE